MLHKTDKLSHEMDKLTDEMNETPDFSSKQLGLSCTVTALQTQESFVSPTAHARFF
jgi:hypothetical protein